MLINEKMNIMMARYAANANCKFADVPIGIANAAQPKRAEHSAERGINTVICI